MPYKYSEDGISYTFAITPTALGKTLDTQVNNLISMMDGYFAQFSHHLNVNVFNRDLLLDAMDHPEKISSTYNSWFLDMQLSLQN